MNNKYIAPTLKIEEIVATDVVLTSAYEITALEGVDKGEEKSAVFNANIWVAF